MHAWQSILALALGCQLVGADELMLPAAPLITGARVLNVRQEQSCPEVTQTLCKDGTGGCCPIGSACTVISGEPRCGGGCVGGHKCLAGGCCDAGYNCPTLGGKFCVPATSAGTLTIQTIDPSPTQTSEPETTETTAEPTTSSESTTRSRPSSTPAPTSTSTPSGDSSSSSPSSPSSTPGGNSSDDASESSSGSPSATESSTDPSESPGAATPSTDTDMAGSLSVSWESWMALAMMVPFIL